MNYKLIYISVLVIIILLCIFKNNNNEHFKDYYKNLTDNWSNLFPDDNRNSASSIFFNYIINLPNLTFEDFTEYNKLYCAVSGSLIEPGRTPQKLIIKELNTEKEIFGDYYMCCWPCLCDLMKYARVVKTSFNFEDGNQEFYAITIANPCNKDDFPSEVNRNYLCSGENINQNKNYVINNRLVIGLLHNAHEANENEKNLVYNDEITGNRCNKRNNMPVDEVQFGMGSIFIKLAN